MRCEDIREMLSEHLDGVLDSAREAQFREHLDSCAACRDELAALEQTVGFLQDMQDIEPPEELYEQIINRIDEEQVRAAQSNVIFAFFGGPQFRAAVAALVVVTVGLFAFRQMSRNPAREANQVLDFSEAGPDSQVADKLDLQVPVPGKNTEALEDQADLVPVPSDEAADEPIIRNTLDAESVRLESVVVEEVEEREADMSMLRGAFSGERSAPAESREIAAPAPAVVPVPSRQAMPPAGAVAQKTLQAEGAKGKERKQVPVPRRMEKTSVSDALRKKDASALQPAAQGRVPVMAKSLAMRVDDQARQLTINAAPRAVHALVRQYADMDKDEDAKAARSGEKNGQLVARIPAARAAEFLKKLNELGTVSHAGRRSDKKAQTRRDGEAYDAVAGGESMVTFVITIIPSQK